MNVLEMERRQESLHSMHTALQYKLNRLNIAESSSSVDLLGSRTYSSLNRAESSSGNDSISDLKPLKQEHVESLTVVEVCKH